MGGSKRKLDPHRIAEKKPSWINFNWLVGKKKNNWDVLSSEPKSPRDVHEEQQIARGKRGKILSKQPLNVGSVVLFALLSVLFWCLWSGGVSMYESRKASGILGPSSTASTAGGSKTAAKKAETAPYFKEIPSPKTGDGVYFCLLNSDGTPQTTLHDTREKNTVSEGCARHERALIEPQWHKDVVAAAKVADKKASSTTSGSSGGGYYANLWHFSFWKLLICVGGAALLAALFRELLSMQIDIKNVAHDTTNLNQYTSDQHVMLVEEVQALHEPFPDVGAHCDLQVSSMISHCMMSNKGIKKVQYAKLAPKDILDEDGDVMFYKGEPMRDENGKIITQTADFFDREFAEQLFEASNLFDKNYWVFYDARKIPYNPNDRSITKHKGVETWADLINKKCYLPDYEVQRPAGVNIVDTTPVNTMILAITRAGKGQTYIEPVLDMWSREVNPNNMVVNDPKGELLVKFYVPLTMRGFHIVQFNLMNSENTDIYNVLGMAAESARDGDFPKCATYVNNIASVFFPVTSGQDPLWPNAAANAFKRAAFGLIDYYLEEERELRALAERTDMDPTVLENKLDAMWGKVSLYNCYQFFVQLSSKKMPNPEVAVNTKAQKKYYDQFEDGQAQYDADIAKAQEESFLWAGRDDETAPLDMLSLYFTATEALPANSMRRLVQDADNSLKAIGGADKMISSVYGIAITAMNFFTDPTIATLTSGCPSQNIDMGSLSFPRRLGVRFAAPYVKADHLSSAECRWSAYSDPMFTERLGPEFDHADSITREGWAGYYFKGIFPENTTYVKLELRERPSELLIKTFYFKFTKSYQKNLNGRRPIKDPILKEKIVRDGVLVELRPVHDDAGNVVEYTPRRTTYKREKLVGLESGEPRRISGQSNAIIKHMVHYCEKPKAIFMITPPHLMDYAKLLLILLKQLIDVSFDKSYTTKENQKPFYKTRYMLDEVGNLQSDGNGIPNLETLLSIGLGQEQQFTLILQTLSQLMAVYGKGGGEVDKIVQANTANMILLKSNDISMLETLEKMSGKTHEVTMASQSITEDLSRRVMKTASTVSRTQNVNERPVIRTEDMLFIDERNSMVFRAGDNPVWNRNQTILPMSWRLFKDTLQHYGHKYNFKSVPTLSSASEFDLRLNQPNFFDIFAKRVLQARRAEQAKELHQKAYGYSDYERTVLDPDVYSDEVMDMITQLAWAERGVNADEAPAVISGEDMDIYGDGLSFTDLEDNDVLGDQAARLLEEDREYKLKQFANGTISRNMLVTPNGQQAMHVLDREMSGTYRRIKAYMEKDAVHFDSRNGNLYGRDGSLYIGLMDVDDDIQLLTGMTGSNDRVHGAKIVTSEELGSESLYKIHDAFYLFLASHPDWTRIAQGWFNRELTRIMMDD